MGAWGGNAIVSVRLSVRLFPLYSVFLTDWPLTLVFCMCVGHYHGVQEIETEGHKQGLFFDRGQFSSNKLRPTYALMLPIFIHSSHPVMPPKWDRPYNIKETERSSFASNSASNQAHLNSRSSHYRPSFWFTSLWPFATLISLHIMLFRTDTALYSLA